MTAPVIDLAARRREKSPSCYRREGWQCYPHRCADLAARLVEAKQQQEGSLFSPTASLVAALDDALVVLAGITEETLPDVRQEVIR